MGTGTFVPYRSTSAAVCRADGLQEAREKAASIAKVILQIFIVFIF
jgi:hypothetical protein